MSLVFAPNFHINFTLMTGGGWSSLKGKKYASLKYEKKRKQSGEYNHDDHHHIVLVLRMSKERRYMYSRVCVCFRYTAHMSCMWDKENLFSSHYNFTMII